MEIQKYKDALVDRAATAFSRGNLDEAAFEALVDTLHAASTEVELSALERRLAPLVPAEARFSADTSVREERTLQLNMSTLKKRGNWVDARRYFLDGNMSNYVLDFSAYTGESNFSLSLKLKLSMSNLKIVIPSDWQVDYDIAQNTASTISDRGPHPSHGSCRILITGSLSMSTLRIRRLRRRRGLLYRIMRKWISSE